MLPRPGLGAFIPENLPVASFHAYRRQRPRRPGRRRRLTTDQSTITLWLQSGETTDLTREAAEQLAGLLMTAVRRLGG